MERGVNGWMTLDWDHYCTVLQLYPYRNEEKKRAALIHDGHVCPGPMEQYKWVREKLTYLAMQNITEH